MSGDLSTLDDWDPLSEEYFSVSFNSYNQGPGVNLPLECLPAFSEKAELVRSRTLCIKNLPVEITEAGLRNLFSGCGKVLGCQRLQPRPEYPDKTIGFVDFRSTREALAAIAKFHEKPPFHLKVNIASMSLSDRFRFDSKKKEELDDVRRRIEERYGVPAFSSPPPGAGRGRGLASSPFPPEDLKDIHVDVGPTGERRVYSSSSSSSSSSRSRRNSSSSSGCSSQSSSCSDDSFKSCESHPCSDIDSSNESLQIVITGNASGDQTRTVAVRDLSALPDQKCVYCGEYAEFLCHNCKAYYCSPKCQLRDWPVHKEICQKKGLLPTPQIKPSEKDKSMSPPKRGAQRNSDAPVKEKISSPQKPSSQKGNAFSSGTKDKPVGKVGQAVLPRKPQDKPAPRSPNKPQTSPQPSQSPVASDLSEHLQAHPKVNKLASTSHLELSTLPLGEDVEVAFSYGISLSEFYVQSVFKMPELAQLQATLQTSCATGAMHKPTEGEYCAALFADDGQWYRARVTSLGSPFTVYFIDYGNMAQVPPESICQLPDQCKELPAQAVRCGLYGVRPVSTSAGWPEEAFSMLASIIQEGTMVANVHSVSEGLHEVELKPKKGGHSLNHQLVARGLAEHTAAAAAPTPKAAAAPTPKAAVSPAPKAAASPAPKAAVSPAPKAAVSPAPKAAAPPPAPKAAAAAPPTSKAVLAAARASNTVASRLQRPEYLKSILNVVKAGDTLPMQVTVSTKDEVWCLTTIPEFASSLVQVEESLQNEGSEFAKKDASHSVTCGDYVASQSSDDKRWYRAYMMEKNASGHTVRYLDYGNDESNTNVILLEPPHKEVPAAAVRLLTSDPTSFRVGQMLSFSVESVDDGTVRGTATSQEDGNAMGTFSLAPWSYGLETKEPVMPSASKPATTSSPSVPQLDSILSHVKLGDTLPMQVTVSARNMVWCLTTTPSVGSPLLKIEQSLQDKGSKLGDKGGTHKVNRGDFVASRSSEDGRWYRACVTEKTGSGHSVRYLDYGNEESNTAIFPLEPAHLEAPAAAVRVLTSDPTSFRVGQLLSFMIESSDGGTVQGNITSEEDGIKMGLFTVAPWNCGLDAGEPVASPSPPKPAPRPATPASASRPSQPLPKMDAKVLHVPQRKLPITKCPMVPVWKTQEVLYLHQQSLASELQAMMEALNSWIKSERPEPTVAKYSKGDYVCALFSEDATWYRGQVMTERSPDGKYLVLFIDFGNSEQLPVSSLHPLPPRFAEAPLFAFGVTPQNVRPADARLATLLEQEPFAAVQVDKTRAGLPIVRLEWKDGTCLNDLIRGVRPKESSSPPAENVASEGGLLEAPAETPPPAYIPDCPVPKSPFTAVVSSVEGNLVYVQPLSRGTMLLKVTEILADKARRDPGFKFRSLPAVNECALALYSEDEQWYRARVVSTDERASTVRVMFVDYGNAENMTAKLLLPIKEELAKEPACAMPIQLEGVPVLSPRAIDFIPKEALVVELVSSATPPLARLKLNGKCINTLAAAKSATPVPKKTFTERPLPVGRTKALVAHVTELGRVYLQQSSLLPELHAMMRELNDVVPDTPIPSPALGDMVCARYAADGLWYRATVVSLPQDSKCKVSFVDFGNDDFVPDGDVRSLVDEFKAIPLFANCVALQGVKSVAKEFVEQLLNIEVEFEVVDASSQPCKAKLYSQDHCLNDLIE